MFYPLSKLTRTGYVHLSTCGLDTSLMSDQLAREASAGVGRETMPKGLAGSWLSSFFLP